MVNHILKLCHRCEASSYVCQAGNRTRCGPEISIPLRVSPSDHGDDDDDE